MLTDYKTVIRNKNFVYLWTSQILSQMTINILNFMLLVKLFEKTNSTIATSFLWVAYALPAILIGPIAASTADLIDRRKILIITNFLQSLVILFYAVSHQTSLFLLYGIALAYSFLNQFYVPAELASLPSLLKKSSLAHANSLFLITQQVAIIIGFGVAGLLLNIFGFTNALYICSILLFFAFISVTKLRSLKSEHTLPKYFKKAIINFFEKIIEGYRYIKENKLILVPLILLLLMHVGTILVVVNMPIMAKQIFKIDINLAGILIAVPAGSGAGIGAIIIAKRLKGGLRKVRVIESSFMLLTLSLFFYAFIIPELSGVLKLIVSIISIFLSGVSAVGIIIPAQTFLQENIPGGLRGRVFGNYWFLATITMVFPVIFSGTITELFGARLFIFLLMMVSLSLMVFINKYGKRFIKAGFSL